jgi:hypothetical protein
MLKELAVVPVVCVLFITAGCSGLVHDSIVEKNNTAKNTDSKITSSNHNSSGANKTDNKNNINMDYPEGGSMCVNLMKHSLNRTQLNVSTITKDDETLELTYFGDFSDSSQTTRELSTVAASFAESINNSYGQNTKCPISRLHITGKTANGSVVWDSIIEDWWAMNYIKNNWDFNNYVDSVVASGELWNVSTSRPPNDGVEYAEKMNSRLQSRTDIRPLSFDKHGGEAFLTYETDHELNSSQYFDEVANVVDVYKNLTLPRSLNRTDGWYAGVLNIEIKNGNDTLEWYRYRIRWAEQRVDGEMTKEEEAGRLRLSRFLEKDRLRDGNETAG